MRTGGEAEILIDHAIVVFDARETSLSKIILVNPAAAMKTAGASQIPAGFNHETISVQFCISAVGTMKEGMLPFNGPVEHSAQVAGNLLEDPIGHRLIQFDNVAFGASLDVMLEPDVHFPLVGVAAVRTVEVIMDVASLIGIVGFDFSHFSSITLTMTLASPAMAEATSAVICRRFVITSERFS